MNYELLCARVMRPQMERGAQLCCSRSHAHTHIRKTQLHYKQENTCKGLLTPLQKRGSSIRLHRAIEISYPLLFKLFCLGGWMHQYQIRKTQLLVQLMPLLCEKETCTNCPHALTSLSSMTRKLYKHVAQIRRCSKVQFQKTQLR